MQQTLLIIAASLTIFIGLAHSILGERYVFAKLFSLDSLPEINGSQLFTKRLLRWAWHITTLAWWGFAAILIAVANDYGQREILIITALTFASSALVSAISSRGWHLSWIVFLSIAAICSYVASTLGS